MTDLKIEKPDSYLPRVPFNSSWRLSFCLPGGARKASPLVNMILISRGPWSSVIIEPENGWHRVSGEVIGVNAGQVVKLSWA